MKTALCNGAAVVFGVLCLSCGKARNEAGGHVWIAREDHGDKPGVEYRIWPDDNGHLTGEIWLFVAEENGRDKERVRYPITITARDHERLSFACKSGDGSAEEMTISFPKGLIGSAAEGVLVDVKSKQHTALKFERVPAP